MRLYLASIAASLLALAVAPHARADLPSYLRAPGGWAVKAGHPLAEYRYHHLPLHWWPRGDVAHDLEPKGRYWAGELSAPDGADAKASHADKVAADFLAAHGWTVAQDSGTVLAHRTVAGHEAWLKLSPWPTLWRIELLEEGGAMRKPSVVAPAATPEVVKDDADFPHLGHFEGYALQGTKASEGVLRTKNGAEWESVHGTVVHKTYASPEDVSPYECAMGYRAALRASGWTLDDDGAIGNAANVVVSARYTSATRDLHASLLCDHHALTISLLDAAAAAQSSKLGHALQTAGHVALYGVYFDVDSDTLRGESEASLKQVLALLEKQRNLRLQIQGHTDASGTPEHNQQLSEARAAAVKAWLVTHKVAAARLTTAGFGATKPIADDASDEGRARNRRVELVRK